MSGALPLVGQAVGAYAFGPIGGIIGGAIGSWIGGAISRPEIQRNVQPLTDLRVVGTEYGQGIPYIRGGARVAGQMWWNSDRIPISSTTSSGGGGKGAAPTQPEVETTTTIYKINILFGLCDQECIGIRRIWDNGDLIWHSSAEATSGTIIASENAGQWDRLTIYTGSEDQLPDPTYEAAIGAGNAPAYRGRTTVFVEGLNLGQSGALRNLTFEVIIDGTQGPKLTYWRDGALTSIGSQWACFSPAQQEVWVADPSYSGVGTSPDRLGVFNLSTETWDYVVLESPYHVLSFSSNGPQMLIVPEWDCIYVTCRANAGAWNTQVFKLSTKEFVGDFQDHLGSAAEHIVMGVDPAHGTILLTTASVFVGLSILTVDTSNGMPSQHLPDGPAAQIETNSPGSGVIGFPDAEGNYWLSYSASEIWKIGGGTQTIYSFDADGRSGDNQICVDTSRNALLYWSAGDTGYLKRFDFDTLTFSRVNAVSYGATSGTTPTGGGLHYDPNNDTIISIATKVFQLDGADGEILNDFTTALGGGDNFIDDSYCSYSSEIVWSPAPNGLGELRFNALTAECPTVADVVEDLCLRAGLTAGQVDVTALSSITRDVCCLPISDIKATRTPLELLMATYYFELTISDKLYFIPRGGSTVATIPLEDLGAGIDRAESGEPLELVENNEVEIPARKTLSYLNLANDYQTGTEESDRLISATSLTVEPLTYAIGLQPGEAKAVIDTSLLDQSSSRHSGEIKVLGDYAATEPTDPVLATGPDGSQFRLRQVERTDSYPLLAYKVVIDDTSVLSNQGITSVDYESQTVVSQPAATLMQLLDIPILRDADNDAGMYVAVKGANRPWPGAEILDSNNDVDYTSKATIREYGVFGTCTTTLGDWTGPRVFDNLNSVTVSLGDNGTLSSATRAAVLSSLAVNLILVGNEILQFIDAELLSPGVYKLTRLLRGSRGTEWAMTGHASGERFVLLREFGMRRLELTNAQLGVSRYYKGRTLGRSLNTSSSQTFTNTGIGLKPFSPVRARVSRDASDNATITWETRSRFSVRMVGDLGISVPPDEVVEEWSIDFYTDDTYTTLATTITASTTTYVFSAADQTVSGLTPGDELFMDIHKVSQVVGRGYPLRRAA